MEILFWRSIILVVLMNVLQMCDHGRRYRRDAPAENATLNVEAAAMEAKEAAGKLVLNATAVEQTVNATLELSGEKLIEKIIFFDKFHKNYNIFLGHYLRKKEKKMIKELYNN